MSRWRLSCFVWKSLHLVMIKISETIRVYRIEIFSFKLLSEMRTLIPFPG